MNEKLRQELEDIKKFLKDYGYHWHGNKQESYGRLNVELLEKQMSANKPRQATSNSRYDFNLPREIDIDVVAQRIAELNWTMKKEGKDKEVRKGADGIHRLEVAIGDQGRKTSSVSVLQERRSPGILSDLLLRQS